MAIPLETRHQTGEPPLVFVSYSHKDEEWKDRLVSELTKLGGAARITVWHDRMIKGGDDWNDEIHKAMGEAAFAICLISLSYLESEFCLNREIPVLLHRRERDGLRIIPVLLHSCPWTNHKWLCKLQMLPCDGKSLIEDYLGQEDIILERVRLEIYETVIRPDYRMPPRRVEIWAPPDKGMVALRRLPMTGRELFGRERDLECLDAAWSSPTTNVVSLVGWGGAGKSTLVNKWLEGLRADNYRGARRLFGWSFYSQGTGERVTAADVFIRDALGWFGDADPTAGSPWTKGERLAKLVRQEKTLLVLDGMESLQDQSQGIKDPALQRLVEELARDNSGLCVITTREVILELQDFKNTSIQLQVEHLSKEAGRAILEMRGIRGEEAELERASCDFGNHALAINLLAAYLRGIPGHQVEEAERIPPLKFPEEKGGHARRVMKAFAHRFGEGPELNRQALDVLKLMGLFDRPADAGCIAALRRPPAIPGLTDHIVRNAGGTLTRWWRRFADSDGQASANELWPKTLAYLRELGLINSVRHYASDELDAHPLVREHFGALLKAERPEAWRAGHARLYEHLRDTAKPFPSTLDEMAPLFQAVHHGCKAERYQETFDDIYFPRICRFHRESGDYCIHELGSIGYDLEALSGFFESPTEFFESPWTQPVQSLWPSVRTTNMNNAAARLGMLGRLREAVSPMEAALRAWVEREDWNHAATPAGNLSWLHLALGDVAAALALGKASVIYADRSESGFARMSTRCYLAHALHQVGERARAKALFEEAEAGERARSAPLERAGPLLISLYGYCYCDLLLALDRPGPVCTRAKQTLQLQASLLGIALDHLSLGRAAQALEEKDEAMAQLDQAVDGLREAGQIQELPRGLLARAALFREIGEPDLARGDLDEARRIAKHSEMRLFQCDAHLEYARLALAKGEKEKARGHVGEARRLVEETGYGRRRPEVEALEAELR
jgi:tetratricopeptide (TPR) repeat protein